MGDNFGRVLVLSVSPTGFQVAFFPNVSGTQILGLPQVRFSLDGARSMRRVNPGDFRWSEAGRGQRENLDYGYFSSGSIVLDLQAVSGGRLLLAFSDPGWSLLNNEGSVQVHLSQTTGIQSWARIIRLGPGGRSVAFGRRGQVVFDSDSRTLRTARVPSDWSVPDQKSLPYSGDNIAGFLNGTGENPALVVYSPRGFAIAPGAQRFVAWGVMAQPWSGKPIAGPSLYCFTKDGQPIWHTLAPEAGALNISDDGRLLVATHTDGTIRWIEWKTAPSCWLFFPRPTGNGGCDGLRRATMMQAPAART